MLCSIRRWQCCRDCFPRRRRNSIELANRQRITAPHGGDQYVSGELIDEYSSFFGRADASVVETVEPSNGRLLESWMDCIVRII